MDEQRARDILFGYIRSDDSLNDDGGCWVYWRPEESGTIEIDGELSADELEAMAWWIRNKKSST